MNAHDDRGTRDDAAFTPSPWANALRWGGGLGIVLIAVLRCVSAFSQQLYFDIDPAIENAEALGAIGMAGSLALDALLLIAAGAAMLGEHLAGRGIRPIAIVLASVGAGVALYHGLVNGGDAGHMWRGSTWTAAIFAMIAIAHLQRDRILRIVLIAVLLSVAAPLLVRGVLQVSIEHQDTIATFEANKQQFLAQQGWAEDSPAAQIYERRLRKPTPRGWFATSNIYGTIMLTCALAMLGGAMCAWKQRVSSGMIGLLGLIVAACAGLIWLTGSRGAVLTMIAAIALLVLPVALPRFARLCADHAGKITLAAIGAAIIAVTVRGVLLPESFAGELSILFRWHYWSASMQIIAEHIVLGVGPDGFQQAYVLARNPRSPEEVVSAHNMLIDWIAMLGVGGVCWCVLIGAWLARFGKADAVDDGHTNAAAMRDLPQIGLVVAAVAVFAVTLLALIPEWHTLHGITAVCRIIGALAAAGLVVLVAWLFARPVSTRGLDIGQWTMGVAACGLLVHSQIEMTIFQGGATPWCLCMIGLAITPGQASARSTFTRITGVAGAVLAAALAVVILIAGAVPARSQGSAIRSAAIDLAAASKAQDGGGVDREQLIASRRRAAQQLVEAHELWPANGLSLLDACQQLRLAARMSPAQNRSALFDRAIELAQRAYDGSARLKAAGAIASVAYERAAAAENPDAWLTAVEKAQQLTELDPQAITPWKSLGDVLWVTSQFEAAAKAYERALANNGNFELDPLKQLPPSVLSLIETRIEEAGDG